MTSTSSVSGGVECQGRDTLTGSATRKRLARRGGGRRGPSALATDRVKREKTEAAEERDDFEDNLQYQTRYTEFLKDKIGELKALALASGADPVTVAAVVEVQWRA